MKLAVIPARGGSKRIPRKNIRDFLGKPVIAYSIEAALQSKLFNQVVVSTDDNEIADVARGLGAKVPFMRPAKLSDDHTGTADVVKHALSWFAEQGTPAEFACCIYATAPFVTSQDLQDGFELLSSSRKSYAFSVTSFGFSIQRALRLTEGGLEPFSPAHSETRSQDLEEAFHDAGQFYWGRATAFLSDVPLFSNASLPVVLPRYRVQDIDTVEDWQRAEFMYRALQMQRDKT
jgi:pseudaminic acid cytidylyltransferase